MDPNFLQYLNSMQEQQKYEQQLRSSHELMRRMSAPALPSNPLFDILAMQPNNTPIMSETNIMTSSLVSSPSMCSQLLPDFSTQLPFSQPHRQRFMSVPDLQSIAVEPFNFHPQLENIEEYDFFSLLQGSSPGSSPESSMSSTSTASSIIEGQLASVLLTPADTPTSSPLMSRPVPRRTTKRDVSQEAGFDIMMATNPTTEPDLEARRIANEASDKPARFKPTEEELEVLSKIFQKNPFPSVAMRTKLAERMGLTTKQIQFWFQNRRQTMKSGGIHVIKPRKRQSSTTPDRTADKLQLSSDSKFFYVDPSAVIL